ncbi:MAG: hypothetical protein N2045_13880 [Fimbriimonadales bacterium]|nr:hypothetical protein [Fimbriimonadales bacterium]
MPTTPKTGRSQYHIYIKTHTTTPTAFVAADKATGINAVSFQVSQNEIEADAYDYVAAVKLGASTNITLQVSQYFDPNDVHLIRVFDAFKSAVATPSNPTLVDVLVVNGDAPATGAKNFYVAGTYRVTQAPFSEGGPDQVANSSVQLVLADGASATIDKNLTSLTGLLL